MIDTYDHATVCVNGEEFAGRVEFEIDAGELVIHGIKAVKEVAKAGEYWYSQDGKPQKGPHFIYLDVTHFVSARDYRDELMAYLGWRDRAFSRAA
mgnify:CR=1 FL=1